MLQLGQRPLSSSEADQRLFVGRQSELDRVHRALALGFNVYLQGEAGVGKTTFLRRLASELGEQAVTPDLGPSGLPEGQLPRSENLDRVQALERRLCYPENGDGFIEQLEQVHTQSGPLATIHLRPLCRCTPKASQASALLEPLATNSQKRSRFLTLPSGGQAPIQPSFHQSVATTN